MSNVKMESESASPAVPAPTAEVPVDWDLWDVFDKARPRKQRASSRLTRDEVTKIITLYDTKKVFVMGEQLLVRHADVPSVIAALKEVAPPKGGGQ